MTNKASYSKGLSKALTQAKFFGVNLVGYRNKLVAKNICPLPVYKELLDVCDGKRVRLTEDRKDWILSSRDGRGCPIVTAMRLRKDGWE